jgi:hypothetical protein
VFWNLDIVPGDIARDLVAGALDTFATSACRIYLIIFKWVNGQPPQRRAYGATQHTPKGEGNPRLTRTPGMSGAVRPSFHACFLAPFANGWKEGSGPGKATGDGAGKQKETGREDEERMPWLPGRGIRGRRIDMGDFRRRWSVHAFVVAIRKGRVRRQRRVVRGRLDLWTDSPPVSITRPALDIPGQRGEGR